MVVTLPSFPTEEKSPESSIHQTDPYPAGKSVGSKPIAKSLSTKEPSMFVIMRSFVGRTTPDALVVLEDQGEATKIANELTDKANEALSSKHQAWDVTIRDLPIIEKAWVGRDPNTEYDYPIYYILPVQYTL